MRANTQSMSDEEKSAIRAEHEQYLADVIAMLSSPWTDEKPKFKAGRDAVTTHQALPEDPTKRSTHYRSARAHVTIAPGPQPVARVIEPENVDYVPRSEPYSFLGVDLCEPVLTLAEPSELVRGRQTAELHKGAASVLRAIGSATASAGVVMEPQLLASRDASAVAIWARLASAYEMLQAGWHARDAPLRPLDVRYVDMDRWPAVRNGLEEYMSMFVPDDWGEEMMAALVSLMVMGGPGAYAWHMNADVPTTMTPEQKEAVMPAGARIYWPGTSNNKFLLVSSRPRTWQVAFGGAALAIGPLTALHHKFTARYGYGPWEQTVRIVAATNRAYAAPVYHEPLTRESLISYANASRAQVTATQGRVTKVITGPFDPGDRPDPWDDGGDFGPAETPFARAATPDADLVRYYAQVFALHVDQRPQPDAGDPPRYVNHVVSDRGLLVTSTAGVQLFPWGWHPPFPAPADAVDWGPMWRRVAAPFLGDRFPMREVQQNEVVDGRAARPRDIFGLQDGICTTRLPSMNWDGWYPVLIGINALARIYTIPRELKLSDIGAFSTRFCTDIHLLAHRMLYDAGVTTASLSNYTLHWARLINAFPRSYRLGYIPEVVMRMHVPYGNWECLESGAFLGGTNSTPYVGFAVPGSWEVKHETSKVKLLGEDATVEGRMREQRAIDAAARELVYHRRHLRLTKPSTLRVFAIRSSVDDGIVHPFFIPWQVEDGGVVLKTGIRLDDPMVTIVLANGTAHTHFSAVGSSL